MEPSKRSRGIKDVFDITDWSFLTDFEKWSIEGCDVLLLEEKKNDMAYPPGIAIRAEARNNNLRFGYVIMEGSPKLKSRRGLLKTLAVATLIISLIIEASLLAVYFAELMPLWKILLLGLVIILPPNLPIVLYFSYFKPKRRMQRKQKRIAQTILRIAEHMGSKRITPYKLTTIKLEEQ